MALIQTTTAQVLRPVKHRRVPSYEAMATTKMTDDPLTDMQNTALTDSSTGIPRDKNGIEGVLDEYGVDMRRAVLLLFGVCMTFALVGIVLFTCEYRRRKNLKIEEIARLKEEDPDAVIDIEIEECRAFFRRSMKKIRSVRMPWKGQERHTDIHIENGMPDDPSSSSSPMTPLQDVEDGIYYDMDEFARAPEASGESMGESSFVSSDDRKDRLGDLSPDDDDYEMQRACEIAAAGEREIAMLCDIAAAGQRSREQLQKTKSEEKMTTQIEIIFAKDLDAATDKDPNDCDGIEEDGSSETWLAEKCVEVVPGNI